MNDIQDIDAVAQAKISRDRARLLRRVTSFISAAPTIFDYEHQWQFDIAARDYAVCVIGLVRAHDAGIAKRGKANG